MPLKLKVEACLAFLACTLLRSTFQPYLAKSVEPVVGLLGLANVLLVSFLGRLVEMLVRVLGLFLQPLTNALLSSL